jgi:predicted Zn-dependent protease
MIKQKKTFRKRMLVLVAIVTLLVPEMVWPQTKVEPGMNFFSVEQDVEMGREAAQEVERQLPILDDSMTNQYISDLGKRLAKKSSMPDLPWQFKVVNSPEVNAFALPGGFIYVNRGLIEAAETEGQLVGVLGHEISHVTLRHGTNQLSKAMLAQAPLALLGGKLESGGWRAALAKMGTAFVINSVFLKFSRTAERQADVVGVQVMHAAGYDPRQMAGMFEILRRLQGQDPSKLEQFFASHPSPENRIERIHQETANLPPLRNPVVNTQRFQSVQSRVKSLPPPPKASPGSDSHRR